MEVLERAAVHPECGSTILGIDGSLYETTTFLQGDISRLTKPQKKMQAASSYELQSIFLVGPKDMSLCKGSVGPRIKSQHVIDGS